MNAPWHHTPAASALLSRLTMNRMARALAAGDTGVLPRGDYAEGWLSDDDWQAAAQDALDTGNMAELERMLAAEAAAERDAEREHEARYRREQRAGYDRAYGEGVWL